MINTYKKLLSTLTVMTFSLALAHASLIQEGTSSSPTVSPINANIEETIQIKGKVIDHKQGSPLSGVAILQKGTNKVILTKNDGTFELEIVKGTHLLFCHAGRHLYEIDTSQLSSYDIKVYLKEDLSPKEFRGEVKYNENVVAVDLPDQSHEDDNEEVYQVVQWMPEYPDGMAGLMKLISENVHYPEDAPKSNRMHVAIVQFIIHTDGSASDFEVVRSDHPAFNEEAIRVLKLMKKWNPGMQNGKKVKVKYTVPVSFRLRH